MQEMLEFNMLRVSYIAFLDADDWVDPLCYENMFTECS